MKMEAQLDNFKNVFLIGLMGAGKTTVGRMLARVLKKDFYDSDLVIEKKTGVRVADIFDIEGEKGFRKRECAVIKDLALMHNIVLATGGGVVLESKNRENLKKNGTVIYLHAQVIELFKRTRNDTKRPLLHTKNVKDKLTQLYEIRDPLYRSIADMVFETRRQGVGELVTDIVTTLQGRLESPTSEERK